MRSILCSFLIFSTAAFSDVYLPDAKRTVYPGGTAVLEYDLAVKAGESRIYISQLSLPDDVCKFLGHEKAIGFEEKGWDRPNLVIEDQGKVGSLEKSDYYDSIVCSTRAPISPAPMPLAESKKRTGLSGIEIFRPEFASYIRFSASSDLGGVCKLYGYNGGSSNHTEGAILYRDMAVVDASMNLVKLERGSGTQTRQALETITCKK